MEYQFNMCVAIQHYLLHCRDISGLVVYSAYNLEDIKDTHASQQRAGHSLLGPVEGYPGR